MSAANQDLEVSIIEKDRLKSRRINLLQADNTIHLAVEGEGCVFAQVHKNMYDTRVSQLEMFNVYL